ncbi:hypothetical protein Q75_00610 [Bacillus coahuilensis p1.1.43]|uniref:LXG domain-containing protein n=1 Tax=Bacillus coahuilensis p1.1.43 TaxID=1150625 RepID=A0A147KCM4_9BACI|nr:LXG domain-containing protein [Bacillus coahuilensis]KUP09456.1 hypothetical protein Q75_00610 [Bacillus coahuilensis p1.1.43]
MKTLDNLSLHSSVEDIIKKLHTQQKHISELKKAIENFAHSKDAFNGQGGEAIRSFYRDFHLPFLSFYDLTLLHVETLLSQLRTSSLQIEGSSNGFIQEGFLKGELTTSLNTSKLRTVDLVDEANQIIHSIRDIVQPSTIQDQAFLDRLIIAHREINSTTEDVKAFDAEQTRQLDTALQDIQLLKRYILEIEGMFKTGKLSVTHYSGVELEKSFHHQPFMNTLSDRLASRNLLLSKVTVSSEYDSLHQLLLLKSSGNSLATSGLGAAQTGYGVRGDNDKEFLINKHVEDKLNSDGLGNASLYLQNDHIDKQVDFSLSGSIIDTKYMDNTPGFLDQKLLYGRMDVNIPYSFKSLSNEIVYGQNIGIKTEAAVSKTSFSHDSSPASLDIYFGQADGKANIENYTASAGGSVSATKIELKIEPLNFFGYEPLEEWFGIEYDPYIGADLSLGSLGIGGSVGLETSVYAALGIGVGLKGGFEKDEEDN